MRKVPLRRYAKILNGGTPTSDSENWSGGIPWATPVDLALVDGGTVASTQRNLTQKGLDSGSRLAPKGSVLVSTRAPIGYTAIADCSLAFNQGCKAVVPCDELDPRYLQYSLQGQREHLKEMGSGSTFMELGNEALAQMPLVERVPDAQRRIADFLDDRVARIDKIIAARRQQLELVDEQERSLIDVEIARDGCCRTTRLGRLASIQTGLTVDSGRRAKVAKPYPYLRVANVQAGHLNLGEIKYVEVDERVASRAMLQDGDVLMTEGGDLDKLARGTVWRSQIEPCLHQNHVFAVRPRESHLIPDYLAIYTESSPARAYFESTGSKTTNLASTSASKVGGLPIPELSVLDQRRTVERVIEAKNRLALGRALIGQEVALLQEYKQSLITAAVTGEFDVTTASTKIPEFS